MSNTNFYEMKGKIKMNCYYVLVGNLENNMNWKQKWLVPFFSRQDAENYRDVFLKNVDGFEVYIIESTMYSAKN